MPRMMASEIPQTSVLAPFQERRYWRDPIEATSPSRPRRIRVPLSQEELRDNVDRYYWPPGETLRHYEAGVIAETSHVRFARYRINEYSVRNGLYSGHETYYQSYSAAAAHFRALIAIEYRGYNTQQTAAGSSARYRMGEGTVRLREFPDRGTHRRCSFTTSFDGDATHHTWWFRSVEALNHWYEHRRDTSPNARVQQFNNANHVNWSIAAGQTRSSTSKGPAVFDMLYLLKGEIKRRQLKSSSKREALEEFQKLAKKYHYRALGLLRARPDGTWEDCYRQGELL